MRLKTGVSKGYHTVKRTAYIMYEVKVEAY